MAGDPRAHLLDLHFRVTSKLMETNALLEWMSHVGVGTQCHAIAEEGTLFLTAALVRESATITIVWVFIKDFKIPKSI